MTPWVIFLNALALVESGGNPVAFNQAEQAVGIYQIRADYAVDAGFPHEAAWSETTSMQIVASYMHLYATPKRLGRDPTIEDWARIHNGGPEGWRRDSTLSYWQKFQRVVEAIQSSL